jgi:hypothetical protein
VAATRRRLPLDLVQARHEPQALPGQTGHHPTVAGLLLGNLGIGLSCGWCVGKHNRRHAHPNQEDADPDIAAGALAFTAAQARAAAGEGPHCLDRAAPLSRPLQAGFR